MANRRIKKVVDESAVAATERLKALEKGNTKLGVEKKASGSLRKKSRSLRIRKPATPTDYGVAFLCHFYRVSRTGFYAWRDRPESGTAKEKGNC